MADPKDTRQNKTAKEMHDELINQLKEMQEALSKTIPTHLTRSSQGGGGGGGDGGPSGPGDIGDSARRAMLDRIVTDTSKDAKDLGDVFDIMARAGENFEGYWKANTLALQTFEYSLNQTTIELKNLKRDLVDMVTEFTSGEKAIRDFTEALRVTTKASKQGLFGISDVVGQMFKTVSEFDLNAMSLLATIKLINDNLEGGGRAFYTSGLNAEKFGQAVKDARDQLDPKFYDFATGSEQSKVMMEVHDTLVAQGIKTDIGSRLNINMTNKQLEMLDYISRNTGLSADALQDMLKQVSVDVNEMAARGLLDPDQAKNMSFAMKQMSQEQQELAAALIQGGHTAGGAAAILGAEKIKLAQMSGDFQAVQGVVEDMMTGRKTPLISLRDNMLPISDIMKSNTRNNPIFTAISFPISQAITTQANALAAYKEKTEEINRGLENALNRFNTVLEENAFLKSIGTLGSALSGLVNVLALHALAMKGHTVALFASAGGLTVLKSIAGGAMGMAKGVGHGLMGMLPTTGIMGNMVMKGGMAGLAGKLGGVAKVLGPAGGLIAGVYSMTDTIINWDTKMKEELDEGKSKIESSAAAAGESLYDIVAAGAMFFGPIGMAVGGIMMAANALSGGRIKEMFGDMVGNLTQFASDTLGDFIDWWWKWTKWPFEKLYDIMKYMGGLISDAWSFGTEVFDNAFGSPEADLELQSLAPVNQNVRVPEVTTVSTNSESPLETLMDTASEQNTQKDSTNLIVDAVRDLHDLEKDKQTAMIEALQAIVRNTRMQAKAIESGI